MHKIYTAYSWIGPTGPLPNYQLPSIFSIADSYNETSIKTDKNEKEDIWDRLFSQNPELFCLQASSTLKEDDVFVFPFKLNVRTPLLHYFSYNNGILEHSFTGGDVRAKVSYGNGYFVFDFRDEAYVYDDFFSAIHSYFKMHGILPYKIIFLTGAMNVIELYEKFCEKFSISSDIRERIKFIACPDYADFHKQITNQTINQFIEPEYYSEIIPEKLFLCWNRRFRRHRIMLSLAMEKLGLIEKSYISLCRRDTEFDKDIAEFMIHIPAELEIDQSIKDRLLERLPLVLDNENNIAEMCSDTRFETRKFYANSLISIITETNYDSNIVTATEKTFKPIREKHPFIIIGAKGALTEIKRLGFLTFDKFWDESYDDISDNNQRMRKIIEVLNEISMWDNTKILDFKKHAKGIVEHNFNLLKMSSVTIILDDIYGHISSTTKIE